MSTFLNYSIQKSCHLLWTHFLTSLIHPISCVINSSSCFYMIPSLTSLHFNAFPHSAAQVTAIAEATTWLLPHMSVLTVMDIPHLSGLPSGFQGEAMCTNFFISFTVNKSSNFLFNKGTTEGYAAYGVWREGSVFKSIGCSSRMPILDSQQPPGCLQLSAISIPENLLLFLTPMGTKHVCSTHTTSRNNTQMHIQNKIK